MLSTHFPCILRFSRHKKKGSRAYISECIFNIQCWSSEYTRALQESLILHLIRRSFFPLEFIIVKRAIIWAFTLLNYKLLCCRNLLFLVTVGPSTRKQISQLFYQNTVTEGWGRNSWLNLDCNATIFVILF